MVRVSARSDNSEAAETARTYLRTNEELKRDIGEVNDFGWFVTGNINTQNADGEATLNLKVIGEKKDRERDGRTFVSQQPGLARHRSVLRR